MRTTLLATLSALALLSAPALAGGTSSQAAGGGGTSAGAAGQSDTGSSMQSGGAGGSTTGATGSTGTAGTTGGASGSQTAVSEDQIRDMLEAEGYTDVSELQQQGDMYQAQAMKDGEQVTVMIDPSTGEIKPQQE